MKRLLLVVAACAIAWVTGCSGGGSSTPPPPPPPVGFSNASLKGAYVFSMTGTTADPNFGSSSFSRVGVFVADGGGDIQTTGGLEDVHKLGANNTFDITGGSYVVNSDGRGTLSLITSGGTVQYSIALTSSSGGYMVDVSGGTTASDTETASGSFQLQTATTLAAGTYIFDFSGLDPASGNAISLVGDFIANATGSGSFSAGSFADVNDAGTLTTKASISGGGYATDNSNPGTGRGLATIGGLDYVYYVIDSQHVQLMDVDPDQAAVAPGTNIGEAVAQQAGTPTETSSFSNSSFVFVVGGSSTTGGPHTRGVRLTATGGALSAILLDDNNAGVVTTIPATANTVLNSGTVTLDGDGSGRGTFTFTENASNVFTFVFYLSSATQGVIQDVSLTNANIVDEVADGTLLAQTGAPFSSSSLATNYAFASSGVGVGSTEEDFVGQFVPASASPNGHVDFNEPGSTSQSVFLNVAFGGVITVGGDGTGSTGTHSTFIATINGTTPSTTLNYFAYIANPSTILLMSGKSTARIDAGVLTAQTP